MLSTVITFQSRQYQVTSRLVELLKERGRTQKDLAKATGFTQVRIHRLTRRTTVQKIVCATAVKICFALSKWKRRKDGRKVRIRFDDLFRIETV
jgi:DNA-binding Xre family transcriptional regulator